jgi:hypothetical protein
MLRYSSSAKNGRRCTVHLELGTRWFRPFCHSSSGRTGSIVCQPTAAVAVYPEIRTQSLNENPVSTASNTRHVKRSEVSAPGLGTRSGREAEAREFQIPSERPAPLPNKDRQETTTLTTTIETQTTPALVPRPQNNKASLAPKVGKPTHTEVNAHKLLHLMVHPILLHHHIPTIHSPTPTPACPGHAGYSRFP